MMKILRVLAVVLGALWFFPVSCTTGLIVGTSLLSHLDARDIEKGEEPHRLFSVVALPGTDGRPFSVVPFDDLSGFRATVPDHSFLMPNEWDRTSITPRAECSYQVISKTGNQQMIEVVWRDDDKTVWSRYRATRSDVTPLSSRMYYQGYMFKVLPFALVFAVVVLVVGRGLRKRLPHAAVQPVVK